MSSGKSEVIVSENSKAGVGLGSGVGVGVGAGVGVGLGSGTGQETSLEGGLSRPTEFMAVATK